ncbi:MAG: hypothetical protein OSJ27_05530 [Candidatus Gastranaerophilales bacterium]|nr:hypothetical protein [Candidatus Gastranaerophilales bacterium]
MGWVTLSLRKMTLKQRISNLEYRLVQISQEQQTLANQSSYAQRYLGMMQNQSTSQLNVDRLNYLKQARSNFSGDSSDYQGQLNLQSALDEINLNYSFEKMNMESVFQAQQDSMLQEINTKQQQLELEQEQLQTQLSAARAEEEQMSQAMNQDIKNGAIKLV